MKKIYLAGPEVFLPEAGAYFDLAKKLCISYGYEGISPFDGEPTLEIGLKKAEFIFQNNCRLIETCDFVIANCNSFRGALIDDGTAFEIGYAYAIGKKIYGFIQKIEPLIAQVMNRIESSEHDSGYRIDNQGFLINEDFGNSINLMMEIAINRSGGKLVEGTIESALVLVT